MKVKISLLFKNGKQNPKPVVFNGEMSGDFNRLDLLGIENYQLSHPRFEKMSADGFFISGFVPKGYTKTGCEIFEYQRIYIVPVSE